MVCKTIIALKIQKHQAVLTAGAEERSKAATWQS